MNDLVSTLANCTNSPEFIISSSYLKNNSYISLNNHSGWGNWRTRVLHHLEYSKEDKNKSILTLEDISNIRKKSVEIIHESGLHKGLYLFSHHAEELYSFSDINTLTESSHAEEDLIFGKIRPHTIFEQYIDEGIKQERFSIPMPLIQQYTKIDKRNNKQT